MFIHFEIYAHSGERIHTSRTKFEIVIAVPSPLSNNYYYDTILQIYLVAWLLNFGEFNIETGWRGGRIYFLAILKTMKRRIVYDENLNIALH